MEQLAQNILNGVTIGTFYTLVALGYTMVYGVLKLASISPTAISSCGALI